MQVTLEQAIEIHARAIRRLAGPKASKRVRSYVERCKLLGDHEGLVVWQRVEEAVTRLDVGESQPLPQ